MNLNFTIKPGPVVNDADLNEFELTIGYQLSAEYREILLKYNGGKPENTKIEGTLEDEAIIRLFYQLKECDSDGLIENYNSMIGRIPIGFLPIAEDECGNAFVINMNMHDTDCGTVYLWDHELEADEDEGDVPGYANLTKISDSFQDLLNIMRPNPIDLEDTDELEAEVGIVSTKLFRMIERENLRNLNLECYQFLTESDLRDLGPEIVRYMNPEYLKTLDPDLLRELTGE